MDKGKKVDKSNVVAKPNKISMDLREIIQEHAIRHLPAKSLCRFRAVCKGWKLQISSPFFEHSQSFAFRSLSGFFCQSSNGSISFISLDPMAYGIPDPNLKFLPEPVDLLASSHGLLCCRGRSSEKSYYICNPVNQSWKKLPTPEANHGQNSSVVLVFDPSLLNFVADYKLICAFPSTDFDGAYEFEIYSSPENSWKISSEIYFGENGKILKGGGLHLNGFVYWLANTYVIGYDLKKNRVKVIPCYGIYGVRTLGIMDRKLCVSSRNGHSVSLSVLFNEYANTMHLGAKCKTWEHEKVKLYDNEGTLPFEVNLLYVGSNVIVYPRGKKFLSYDLKTKESTDVSNNAEFNNSSFYVPYVNSLVCL